MSTQPPSLLRRVLERALPEELREGIVGDLDEVFADRRRTRGPFRARVWYAGQVMAFSARFTAERMREALSLRGSSFGPDLKLGLRMLIKYPMLTAVGGLAIMIATALGVGANEFMRDLFAPRLPLDEGERIVRLQQVDVEAGGPAPASLYDLRVWKEGLASVEDLGAYALLEQGLVSDRDEIGTVSLARMSASGFRVTRVPPQLGRFLLDADELPDAPHVVVLGDRVWRGVLGADPDVIGRTVRIGSIVHTVVGVMPAGYAFPSTQDAWAPLRAEAADLQPETARRAALFGRLAEGATLESAQTELDLVGQRTSADHPAVYAQLSPRVTPFAQRATLGQRTLVLSGVGLLFIFLLVVACANVATLVFARTVTREGEIAVRTSLGATRRRIVFQLFAESLVLVGGATALGLVLARFALGRISRLFFVIQQEPQPPFWWDDGLSGATVAYALLLALVGAVMIGVVPALKATSGTLQPRLGQLAAGRGGGLRFGGVWTVVIVLQVALSVAFLPLAVSQGGMAFDDPVDTGFPATSYVTAQLGRDITITPATSPEERAALADESFRLFETARDRIASDPAVEGAALASGLSAMNHLNVPVEYLGGGEEEGALAGMSRVLLVDRAYLDLMGATVSAGRTLGAPDFGSGARSVVVNEAFVKYVLGGRNPVGGRIHFADRGTGEASVVKVPAEGEYMDVVGVVQNPGIDAYGPGVHPVIYAPLDLAPVTPLDVGLAGMPQAPAVQLFVRTRPDGGPMTARLYGILSSVDGSLRMAEIGTAAEAWDPVHKGARIAGWIFLAMAGIVLMLSVAGIYALMSFTVSRRTREIAIRAAVGAHRRGIVRIVFGRAIVQLLAGVALGSLVAVPVLVDGVTDQGPQTLVIVSLLLIGAGVAACLVPVRRALAIQPAAAMKAD